VTRSPHPLHSTDLQRRRTVRKQTFREEVANAATHGVGMALSAAGGAVLAVLAALSGSAWKIAGVSIFIASLLLLYTASTMYHLVRPPLLKRRLQVLDHCAIYVLIAGTYTPFMLDAVRGPWGWSLFGMIWGLAVIGIVFKLRFTGRYHRLSTAVYLAMGWLAIVAAVPLYTHVPFDSLAWLVAGGVTYTLGTAFYHWQKLPFAHAVWHLFVVGGSICHGIAVGVQL
jgi:hemolysin III